MTRSDAVKNPPLVILFVLALLGLGAGQTAESTEQLVRVFESGGISDATLAAAERLGGTIYEEHSGTLRMMGVTRGDAVVQEFPPSMGVPMRVSAYSDEAAAALVGERVTSGIAAGGVVMSYRTAALRGALVSDVITLEGWNGVLEDLEVVDIVDDAEMGWSELAINRDVADSLGFERVSFLGVVGDDAVAMQLRRSLGDVPIRISGPGETVDRTDFVLPSVLVKERFGEFSFRPLAGDDIEIDPDWVESNIVTVNVPPLGVFECHRLVVPYIRSALVDLTESSLIDLIDPADFQLAGGCFNSRRIRGGDKGFALSRHAWGIAIDINPSTNRFEEAVSLPTAFGQTFREWGFAWGAGWLRPDGMHFEWSHVAVPEVVACSTATLAVSGFPGVSWNIVERTVPCS
jgi:hypothetical protein